MDLKKYFNKMNKNGNNKRKERIKQKKYLFFILIFLLITPFQSFKYYKAFILLSKNILLITDEGII